MKGNVDSRLTGGAWESSDSQDSSKVVGSEPTRASAIEGGGVPDDEWEVIDREDIPILPTIPCTAFEVFTSIDH